VILLVPYLVHRAPVCEDLQHHILWSALVFITAFGLRLGLPVTCICVQDTVLGGCLGVHHELTHVEVNQRLVLVLGLAAHNTCRLDVMMLWSS
jgi:hypothetical protein